MTTLHQLTLNGFNGETDATDHLILWVDCPDPSLLEKLDGVCEHDPISENMHLSAQDIDIRISEENLEEAQALINSKLNPEPKVVKACSKCGSHDVTNDAISTWSVDKQDWVIASLLDNADCEGCGSDGHTITEAPL